MCLPFLLGTKQKSCFPVDVVCNFDYNECGFKEATYWKWVPKEGIEL